MLQEEVKAEEGKWEWSWEKMTQPYMIGVYFVGIVLIIATGTIVTTTNSTFTIAKSVDKKRRDSFKLMNVMHTIMRNKNCWLATKKFWHKLPRRFWNFYIEALLIPAFRVEWGKYKIWSFRSPPRPERSAYVKKMIKERKRLESLRKVQTVAKPIPIPHNHHECQRIKINVNGRIYETQLRTLNRYPDTILGDPERRIRFYDPEHDWYFFDRHRASFEFILYFYQSGGIFRRPENIHTDIFLDDAEFYQISESVIQNFRLEEGIIKDVEKPPMPENLFQRKVWLLFDYPESSAQARVLAIISVFVIILSIFIFCVETMPIFSGKPESYIHMNGHFQKVRFDSMDIRDPLFFTETICSVWFTVELLMRFLSSPNKIEFIRSFLNLIDLVAIMPYFLTIATVKGTEITDKAGSGTTASLSILRVIRLVRVFRIFKLSRHSKGLQILGRTLHASISELGLLVFFVFIGIILFSSTMYFAEKGEAATDFESIPDGFWWAITTMTTVGYGDMVPRTVWGKVVGTLCSVTGVLTIALPVPVIVSNFNYFYHQAIDEQEFIFAKINHVNNCPYRPGAGCQHPNDGVNDLSNDSSEFEELKYKEPIKKSKNKSIPVPPLETPKKVVRIKRAKSVKTKPAQNDTADSSDA